LKFTGLAFGFRLWETVPMPNKKAEYVPKVYDTVLWKSGKTAFIVMRVDAIKETVDLKSTAKFGRALDGHVPWSELSYLDESQNALRVVREATE
jgi:hypothetical protein